MGILNWIKKKQLTKESIENEKKARVNKLVSSIKTVIPLLIEAVNKSDRLNVVKYYNLINNSIVGLLSRIKGDSNYSALIGILEDIQDALFRKNYKRVSELSEKL